MQIFRTVWAALHFLYCCTVAHSNYNYPACCSLQSCGVLLSSQDGLASLSTCSDKTWPFSLNVTSLLLLVSEGPIRSFYKVELTLYIHWKETLSLSGHLCLQVNMWDCVLRRWPFQTWYKCNTSGKSYGKKQPFSVSV